MNVEQEKSEPIPAREVLIAYPSSQVDEIDLIDLIRNLWQYKIIIIGTIVASVILSLLILSFLPRIYRAETMVLPPSQEDVAALYWTGSKVLPSSQANGAGFYVAEIIEPDPAIIFQKFLQNLQSTGLRYRFVREYKILNALKTADSGDMDAYELFRQGFDKQIQIRPTGKGMDKTGASIAVTLKGVNREKLSGWLDDYFRYVDAYTTGILIKGVQARIRVRAEDIRAKIAVLRQTAARERADRIVQVKEAIAVAKRLGIKKPIGSAFATQARDEKLSREHEKQSMGMLLDSENIPLYYRGEIALQTELARLQQRKNDDAFIFGLRELQGELALLEKRHFDPASIHSARLDRPARTERKPVRPKVKLIIALATIMGAVLGGILALTVNYVRSSHFKQTKNKV